VRIRWYGQAAFLVTDAEHRVFIDPFGDVSGLTARGIEWRYPSIENVAADVVLVTHDHLDHNAVEVIAGEPTVIRSAGTHDSPIGEVVGIASEHDAVAGTNRGANVIFRFLLDGLQIAHLGDLGQTALRPEQRAALGDVDVLFIPVGQGPTMAAEDAARLVRELEPRLIVAMHFRTDLVGFLDPPDTFLAAVGIEVEHLSGSEFEVEELLRREPIVAVPSPPLV
jgi:L-ascorbate metabolism protein UlaG (beta-lactamase superfamily)